MSTSCNGVNDFSETNNSVAGSQACINNLEKEDTAIETVFKGFAKIPAIRVPRIDITPYLNGLRINDQSQTSDISKHLCKFGQVCNVNVVRDNLIELKKTFKTNMTSPSSSISTDNGKANVKCKICEKVYSSEKKLQNHQQNKHMIEYSETPKTQKRVSFSDHVIVHELKEYHRCRKCTKIFEDYKSLRTHMKQQHRKRKCYICHYCSKDFVDRMFFKVHIKLHCDVCGELLPNKSKYNDHRRIVCKVLKLYKCKTCDETFYKFMDLKDHSYDHLGTFFICDICKDQLDTKCAVAHHISFLHSKKRPTALYDMRNLGSERLYLCNFCDETSVEKDVIENHVQTLPDLTNRAMTGYKDFYFCDQCLKKFDSEKEMLQHKWSHFLSVADNSQKRPKSILSKSKFTNKVLKVGEKVPEYMLPKVVLEKIKLDNELLNESVKFVLPKTKKTVLSRHQCQTCGNCYSSSSSLMRHIKAMHSDFESLTCKVCSVKFQWFSQLRSHKCILKTKEKTEKQCSKELNKPFSNLKEIDESTGEVIGTVINLKSKKTLLSKHQCQTCGKYYSSNHNLNRHIETTHPEIENLQCRVCEEKFAWPSLLQSHRCIRLNLPEMPFDDARPEIHFDNLQQICSNGFDDLNIEENDDYMHTVDFEIPTPIVELTECEQFNNSNINGGNGQVSNVQKNVVCPLQSLGYKVVMQEVPIEF